MMLNEVVPRARRLKVHGWDGHVYESPFPIEHITDALSLLYLGIKDRLTRAPMQMVKLGSLTAIQSVVTKSTVTKYKTGQREPILVARINGKNYIIDGTHRATAAWANREDEISAHFLEYKDLDMHQTGASRTSEEWNAILDKAQV